MMLKENYRNMQINEYAPRTRSLEESKNLCVGNWIAHETYPYEKYLLENYRGLHNTALDFGCGIGRMIKRMQPHFLRVDGADLMLYNIQHCKEYLNTNNSRLFVTDGLSCNIHDSRESYDFIYSTICLQHICVYEIRTQILKDFYRLLNNNKGSRVTIQVGFGWNNGVFWNTNKYDAPNTNGVCDFSIPNTDCFPLIKQDIIDNIGFKKINFRIKENPHPYITNYHTNWLFIDLEGK